MCPFTLSCYNPPHSPPFIPVLSTILLFFSFIFVLLHFTPNILDALTFIRLLMTEDVVASEVNRSVSYTVPFFRVKYQTFVVF